MRPNHQTQIKLHPENGARTIGYEMLIKYEAGQFVSSLLLSWYETIYDNYEILDTIMSYVLVLKAALK